MKCFHKLLSVSFRDHITNEEVKARVGNAIGPYEDLRYIIPRKAENREEWRKLVVKSTVVPR